MTLMLCNKPTFVWYHINSRVKYIKMPKCQAVKDIKRVWRQTLGLEMFISHISNSGNSQHCHGYDPNKWASSNQTMVITQAAEA
jgi:hypothetical protein